MPVRKVLPAKTKATEAQPSMLKSMKIPHIIGSYLGLLPTCGATSNTPTDLHFRWTSPKTAYTLLYFFMGGYLLFNDALWFVKASASISQLLTLIYRVLYTSVIVAFFVLSRGLPKLMMAWTKMDQVMNKVYGYPRSFDSKLKIFTAGYFIVSLAIVGINMISFTYSYTKADGSLNFDAYFSGLSVYYSLKNPVCGYIVGVCIMFIYIHATFALIYNGYILTLYSSAISLRLEQINQRIEMRGGREYSKEFWIKVRADYVRLAKLCRMLNSYVSFSVMLSFASNMQFVVVNIFTLLNSGLKIPIIYYLAESGLYMFNCVILSVYTAWINEASKKPAAVLNTVLSYNYDREIHRLLVQIAFDNVALRGGNLFVCTRRLILNIAGAIITYELALIQLCGN